MFNKKFFKKLIGSPYLIFFEVILIGFLVSTKLTSRQVVLQSDAGVYLQEAVSLSSGKFSLPGLVSQKGFIDVGYSFVLSILVRIFGVNILLFQMFNYIFWLFTVIFIFKTLELITTRRKAFLGSFVMALSPTFLTFSAKLYSEPFAALGMAAGIYFLTVYKVDKSYLSLVGLVVGVLLFIFTRSIFTPLSVPVFVFAVTNKSMREYIMIAAALVILGTRFYFSYSGGRSDYNLVIQLAKVYQPYSTIGACAVYNLSYPLGRGLLPAYEGACHQNNPQATSPRYEENPYVLAEKLRGNFNLQRWVETIFINPIKYFAAVMSSVTSLIFVEGFYAGVTADLNYLPGLLFIAPVKIAFALYIWFKIYRNFKLFIQRGFWISVASIAPLLYFIVIVGNYSIEQRWFYPLFPWAYFYAALDRKSVQQLIHIFEG